MLLSVLSPKVMPLNEEDFQNLKAKVSIAMANKSSEGEQPWWVPLFNSREAKSRPLTSRLKDGVA